MCLCVCAHGEGGIGNVLGALVQMLSHSSVVYLGAASRDRQDGCITEWATEKEEKRKKTVQRRRQGLRRREGEVWVFVFSEGTPKHH